MTDQPGASLANQVPTSISNLHYCHWCFGIGNSRCGRCHNVYYCSKDHQMQHWPMHKADCKIIYVPDLTPPPLASDEVESDLSFTVWSQSNIPSVNDPVFEPARCDNASFKGVFSNNVVDKGDFTMPTDEEILSSLSDELLVSNSFWDVADISHNYVTVDILSTLILTERSEQSTQQSDFNSISESFQESNSISLMDICANVVHDLNMHGICVIDKFIGANLGDLILEEVKAIYGKGVFKKGEIFHKNTVFSRESVRNDVITWVSGTEPECCNMGNLIRTLDAVITTCNKMKDNGVLSNYKLHRRTKAMIACYPGDGTHYKKHIDNPDGDGRCVTCIYYLNKNWDIKKHGGLLRMFPSIHNTEVANIEPVFDRMLFFWSDKRNPHEVLPAFVTRFAITVWYFDADERDRAISRTKI